MTLTKPFSWNSQWFFYINFYQSQKKTWRKYGHFIYAIPQIMAFTAPVLRNTPLLNEIICTSSVLTLT